MMTYFKTLVDKTLQEETLECDYIDDELIIYMKDNSLLRIKKYKESIIFNREGNVRQKLLFKVGKITPSLYETKGLRIPLQIKTIALEYEDMNIFVHYELYQDNSFISDHKIWINVDKSLEKMTQII